MTLRVTVEIVPFGNEEAKYEINRIDISNQGLVRNPAHTLVDKAYHSYTAKYYRDGELFAPLAIVPNIHHCRDDGAFSLIRQAIDIGIGGEFE